MAFTFLLCYLKENEMMGTQAVYVLAATNELILKKRIKSKNVRSLN